MVDNSNTNTRWPSEREVADEVPIDIDVDHGNPVLTSVPLWFHTFALDRDHPVHARQGTRPRLPIRLDPRFLRRCLSPRRRDLRRLLQLPG